MAGTPPVLGVQVRSPNPASVPIGSALSGRRQVSSLSFVWLTLTYVILLTLGKRTPQALDRQR